MPHIFISYSSEDRAIAKTLADALHDQGWQVWWDRKIPVGKSFNQVIEDAIDSAQCVVVIWTDSSVESDWVCNEAQEGKRRNILVPVRLGEVRIPLGFRHLQAADLQGWQPGVMHPEYESLLESIRAAFAESTDKKSPELPKAKRPAPKIQQHVESPLYIPQGLPDSRRNVVPDQQAQPKSRKAIWIGAGLAAVVIVAAVIDNLPQDDYYFPTPASDHARDVTPVVPPQVDPALSNAATPPPAAAIPNSAQFSLQWQDHAVQFNGTLTHNGGVQGQIRATLHDLRTGQQLSDETFPVHLATVGVAQYLISGEVVIPNGDSTTQGRHTHAVYIQAQQYPNGSWVAQNCTPQGCFAASIRSN